MLKKLILAAVGVSLLVGAIVYVKLGQFAAMDKTAAGLTLPLETVTAVAVIEAHWEQVITATCPCQTVSSGNS